MIAATAFTAMAAAHPPVTDAPARPKIQVALLLDTSNSMDGLIHQAKTQLWRIVNEFAYARKHGRQPQLEVALFEYGNNGLPAGVGYIRMASPFTTDLDSISAKLFALSTNGGEEYCGQVIQAAIEQLSWHASPEVLKMVYIAGNEPFGQGPVDFRRVCPNARQRGILVNTIHCGDRQSGVGGRWEEGALLGGGSFASINSDLRTVIDTPYDAELARLGQKLNETYVPYGSAGAEGKRNQARQDSNAAAAAPSVAAARAEAKASALYTNGNWDLVDAARDGKVKVEQAKEAELPAEMRKMTVAERKAHIEKMGRERAATQQAIGALQAKRAQYVTQQQSKPGTGEKMLEDAMVASIRRQAVAAGFEMKAPGK